MDKNSPEVKRAIEQSMSNLMSEIATQGGYDCTGCRQPKKEKAPHQIGVHLTEKPEPRVTVYPLCKICALKAKVDPAFNVTVMAHVKERVEKAISAGEVATPPKANEFTSNDYKILEEQRGAVHAIYPSGKQVRMKGVFRIMEFAEKGINPTMEDQTGKLFMFDARAIVKMNGKIIYNPRSYTLAPEMDQWLKDHPEWAPEPSPS